MFSEISRKQKKIIEPFKKKRENHQRLIQIFFFIIRICITRQGQRTKTQANTDTRVQDTDSCPNELAQKPL